jgi:hypothetical protein
MVRHSFRSIAVAALLVLPCAAAVTVSSPANNATVSSPTHVVAKATATTAISSMAIYVDNVLSVKVSGASIDKYVSMSVGTHKMVVQAWDSTGTTYKTPLTLTVSTTSGDTGGSGTSTGTTISNIDSMTGWQDCGACAGRNGTGPTVPYSMTQNISSPSLDGNAAKFSIGGSTAYANALWWKQLGAKPSASHFIYNIDFYLTNPSAAQALEFDMNQSLNGRKYIFGTECSFRGSKQWDVWDSSKHWIPTGIACPVLSAYTWHHLTIEAERSGTQTHFISITLDGTKHYVNRYQASQTSGSSELNVAVQMDENGSATNYSMWTDKISLTYY